MKIGILTQPLHANYGGLLQNFALQQTLIKLGHEPETIDWSMPNTLRYRLSLLKASVISAISSNKRKACYILSKKERNIIQKNTNYFISKYIRHTPILKSSKDFEKQSFLGGYEAYVVGSDQCWRPGYNYFLKEMFLSFVANKQVKRLAYAASFGTDTWEFNERQTSICAPLARQFDLISVREDTGVDLCHNYLGVDAVHVLDPTMLLSKDEYITLVKEEKEDTSKGSLFFYILDPSEEKTSFIKNIAAKNGLTPFSVMPKYQAETRTKEVVRNSIDDCVFPSVTQWLRAFMDAEMTVVDSFHGMVFSIIFNKPFWVIGNEGRGMSRFSSLLKLLQLEDRLINIKEINNIDFNREVNWTSVNNKIQKHKEISLAYLSRILN